MATLKTIRTRIISVKNTQKITKAMKMVAAAKLRRAQQAVVSSRPYANGLKEVIMSVSGRGELNHALFRPKQNPKRASFLLFTSNRGLCGGFNSNLLRQTETYLKSIASQYEVMDIKIIGKKGRDFYASRGRKVKDIFLDYADCFSFEQAYDMAESMINQFSNDTYDDIYIVYNRFKSALSQEVQIEKLIPISLKGSANDDHTDHLCLIDFIYEPSKTEVLDYLIPKYVATQLYRAHLESVASELGSRMTAMESATNNASDMIGKLTLQYNRLRQAAITTELMDIVNGAESIK